MDTRDWRRQLDKLSDMKGMLISLNPTLEEQADRQVRQLYDSFATLTKVENDLGSTSGLSVLKKRKLQSRYDELADNIEEDFMTQVRDFADQFRKEHRAILSTIPRLDTIKPSEVKALSAMKFPSIGAGDMNDFETLLSFADAFSKKYIALHQGFNHEVKQLLDSNKRTLETYERHITIDRSNVTTTASREDIEPLVLNELVSLWDTLKSEAGYLDGRKDEVSRMISVSLVSEVESLQASVETASRLGLELPMDFTKQIRIIARDAAKANDLTTLISLENQLQTAALKVAAMLRDRIINMKHEVTTKIVSGGIPTSADVIPEAPPVSTEGDDVANLLGSYQKMVEWSGQVKIALKDTIEEALEDVEKATEYPDETGIKDIVSVREFLANSKKELKKAEIDDMISIWLKAKAMQDEHKKNVTDLIREYIARFNELATSADRVLDYAQLSKKAPKVEELEGGIVYLLTSLENLKEAVESGVATFRGACEQEIDAITQDLQTIKPVYAEIFMPIISELDEGLSRIKVMTEFAEIRSEMRSIKEGILAKAKDALENLRYRLGVKIRLAAAKLMGAGVEIPPEVQEAISELNNIAVAADTVFSLPAIARKMIELYEKKITGKIIESLVAETTDLEDSFKRAMSIGVGLQAEVDTLGKIRNEPPRELEDAADAFDSIRAMTTSPEVKAKVDERAESAQRQLSEAISLFEDRGMSDFVQRLRTLLDQAAKQRSQATQHVGESLEVCLTLATVQDEMLTVIKQIADKDKEEHDKEIRKKSQYYTTIERVYEGHTDDFSRLIFDLKSLRDLEAKLNDAEMLDEALQYFNQLRNLRDDWTEKAEKMDDWHKTLRMYMTGFSPSASSEDRKKFIDDKIKQIKETFTKEDISSYLIWAINELASTMVKKRTK